MLEWLLALALIVPGVVLLFVGQALLTQVLARFAPGDLLGGPARAWRLLMQGAPVYALTLQAAQAGADGLALGVVVGSTVLGFLLTLGLALSLWPGQLEWGRIMPALRMLIAASLLLWWLGLDARLGQRDGLLLLGALALWLMLGVSSPALAPLTSFRARAEHSRGIWQRVQTAAAVLVALLLLAIGARLGVMGAQGLAYFLGVDGRVIGLTLMAAALVLPALVSCGCALRRAPSQALVQIITAKSLMLLGALGLGAATAPAAMRLAPEVLHLDVALMTAAPLVYLVLWSMRGTLGRADGMLALMSLGGCAVQLIRQL